MKLFSWFGKKKSNHNIDPIDSVVAEIEVYIAYGLEKKAATLLKTSLEKHPNNKKLLLLNEQI